MGKGETYQNIEGLGKKFKLYLELIQTDFYDLLHKALGSFSAPHTLSSILTSGSSVSSQIQSEG